MDLERDPAAGGRLLAAFFAGVESRLWKDLVDTGTVPPGAERAARVEWECLALDACLRGLVAAGGFGGRTADAVDAFHADVLAGWSASGGESALATRRERLAARYEAYGVLARAHDGAPPARVSEVLAGAAAGHACAPAAPPEPFVRVLAAMHEAVTEGAMAALAPEPPPA